MQFHPAILITTALVLFPAAYCAADPAPAPGQEVTMTINESGLRYDKPLVAGVTNRIVITNFTGAPGDIVAPDLFRTAIDEHGQHVDRIRLGSLDSAEIYVTPQNPVPRHILAAGFSTLPIAWSEPVMVEVRH
jgi:hypothetical protein